MYTPKLISVNRLRVNDYIVLFGAPGVGKSTIARKLGQLGYPYVEGDNFLLPEVVELNRHNRGLTPELRDKQHEFLFFKVGELVKKHNRLVFAYDFMWDRYRIKFAKNYPMFRWIYLVADSKTISERVKRPGHILAPAFAIEIYDKFEEPSFPVDRIETSISPEAIISMIIGEDVVLK